MATKAVDLILVNGKHKLPVSLDTLRSPLSEDHLTVNHLCHAVQQETNIKPEAQKLIFRGRTLFKSYDPEGENLRQSLSSLGMKNGDRVMVFGKPAEDEKKDRKEDKVKCAGGGSSGGGQDAEEDALMKVLDQHQARIEQLCKVCRDTVDAMGDNPAASVEEWRKQRKFFLGQSEYSMQELTRLDATPGSDATRSPGYKTRRKALVNTLLENMTLCDSQVSRLSSSIQAWEQQQQHHSSHNHNS